jgi:hypothetical protein
MPQAVIPFKLNPQSFVISMLVIMVVVRLVFVVLDVIWRWAWWLKRMKAWMKSMHVDGVVHRFSMSEYASHLTLRRDCKNPDTATYGIEMV